MCRILYTFLGLKIMGRNIAKAQSFEVLNQRINELEMICSQLSVMMRKIEMNFEIDTKIQKLLDSAKEQCEVSGRTVTNNIHLHVIRGGKYEEI